MNDAAGSGQELIADFMRLRELDGVFLLQVGIVDWGGRPHSPELIWKTFRQWKISPNAARLAAAQQKALRTARFFGVCELCGERCNAGHMHGRNLCRGCADRHRSVAY